MTKGLVDTSAWVALKYKRDSLHSKAHALNRRLLDSKYRYITTNFILDETYTLLASRTGHSVAIEFGEEIRESKVVEIVSISQKMEDEAWELFKKYSDKKFSFTDCTSFVVMQNNRITECFTDDHNFEQVGFNKLLI